MKISKLEVSRAVEAYLEYKESKFEDNYRWSACREYLSVNGLYDIIEILENLISLDKDLDTIIEVLIVLGVEVQ